VDPGVDAVTLRLVAGVLLCWPGAGRAHSIAEREPGSLFEPWLIGMLAIAAMLYASGLAKLWKKAGPGRGISKFQAASFAVGWAVLAAALLSPLDELGALYFSAHMVQHELLMVVAAPLLVLGRPVETWTWGLRPEARRRIGSAVRVAWFSGAWRLLNTPPSAWILHAMALWTWHVPSFFDAAVAHEGIHVLQHASFLGSALLFWSAMLRGGPQGSAHAACLFGLFTTMAHSGALGALLAFAPAPWYDAYATLAPNHGYGALEDQQLGGLIMWVPGTIAYLLAGLLVMAKLLYRTTRRGEPTTRPLAP
jgi:putative membrane protein